MSWSLLQAFPAFSGAEHHFGLNCCAGEKGGKKIVLLGLPIAVLSAPPAAPKLLLSCLLWTPRYQTCASARKQNWRKPRWSFLDGPITDGVEMKNGPSLLPEPRSYAGTAVTLGAVTALPFAVLWSWLFAAMQQRPFGEILPFGLAGGIFFGLFFGLAMAFFLKGKTATIEVGDKGGFVSRLNVAMAQLGYNPATQADDFFTYKPSFQAGLAAGRISVQLQEGRAVIVGPKMYVKKLLKRLAAE
jgi:hypothetical protein